MALSLFSQLLFIFGCVSIGEFNGGFHENNSSPVLYPVVELDCLINGIVINIANSTGVLPIVAKKVARAAVHAIATFSKIRQYNSQPIPNTRFVISQILIAIPIAVYLFVIS